MNLKCVLTASEYEVAEQIARGYSEQEIAATRFTSYVTVKTQSRNIRKKIGARCAVDVARTFILSLDNPKKFFMSLFFVSVQVFAITQNHPTEVRKLVKRSRVVRIVKKQ